MRRTLLVTFIVTEDLKDFSGLLCSVLGGMLLSFSVTQQDNFVALRCRRGVVVVVFGNSDVYDNGSSSVTLPG